MDQETHTLFTLFWTVTHSRHIHMLLVNHIFKCRFPYYHILHRGRTSIVFKVVGLIGIVSSLHALSAQRKFGFTTPTYGV